MNTQRSSLNSSLQTCRKLCLALLLAMPAQLAWSQDESFDLEEAPAEDPADAERRADLVETRNWVEIGAGYVSDDSGRFGRYSGLNEQGGYGVLNFEWAKRAAYNAPAATYWRISGNDLGLDSRELEFEVGLPGRYRLNFGFDQLSAIRSDDAQTIFTNPGDSVLTLPSNWVGGQTTAGMPGLLSSLRGFDLDQVRRRFDLGFDAVLRERWDFSTDYRRETKDGNRSIGGVIGNSGGNPRAIILPEPVDYVTDRIDSVLRFGDQRKQFQFGYYGSLFHNDNASLTWQNPYTAITGWAPSAGFPTGYGSLSLPPDNQFHQLSAAGAFNMSDRTRFSGDVSIGRMSQDERFLPYSINPTLAASVTQPLPRDSLDGEIDTTVVNLRMASRPTGNFFWNASFRYDDRDNQTPRDQYVYIGGDSQTQNTAATSSFRRYNEPYSYRDEKLRVDAGYHANDWLDFTAAAERRRTERTYSEREEADEDSLHFGVRSDVSDRFSAGLRLSATDRDGSTYVGNEPFLSGYDPGYTSTVPGLFENAPALRKYHLADRRRDQATLYATFTPNSAWSFGLNAAYLEDDYKESELGLAFSRANEYGVDVTFAPGRNWSAYGFYTYEKLASDQNGRSMGGATRVADSTNPLRSWFADHRDHINSYGIGVNSVLADSRWSVGADLVRSRSDSNIYVSAGTALGYRALPEDDTRLNSASAYLRYRWNRDLSFSLRYWFESYRSSDFALDGILPNQLANVILLGEQSPDYRVHVIGIGLTYQF